MARKNTFFFSYSNLLEELKLYPDDWYNYLRIDMNTYHELLNTVAPFIQRQDTCMRKAIILHERLSATLRYLAIGRSYEDFKYSLTIYPRRLSKIFPEFCQAIQFSLKGEYMKVNKSLKNY